MANRWRFNRQSIGQCMMKHKPRNMHPAELEKVMDAFFAKVDELEKAGYDPEHAAGLAIKWGRQVMREGIKGKALGEALQSSSKTELDMGLMAAYGSKEDGMNPRERESNVINFLTGLLVRNDKDYWNAKRPSVDSDARAIREQAYSLMGKGLELLSARWSNLLSTADGTRRLLAAMYEDGNPKDSEAVAAAAAFKSGTDFLYERMVGAGMPVRYRDNYHVAIVYDMAAVSKVGRAEFIKDMLTWMDTAEMSNSRNLPYTGKQLEKMIGSIYDGVTGMPDAAVHAGGPQSYLTAKLAVRGLSRMVKFKGSKQHISFHQKYGRGSIGMALFSEVDNLSHEIALAKVFGPRAQDTFEYLLARAGDLLQNSPKWQRKRQNLEHIWQELTGYTNIPQSERLANLTRMMLNLKGSAVLGGAVISAFTDVVTSGMTAMVHRQTPFHIWRNQATAVFRNLTGDAYKEDLRTLGFSMASTIRGVTQASARMMDEYSATGASGVALDTVIRMSGLDLWTRSLQAGSYLRMQHVLAKETRTRKWDQLGRDKVFWQQYGLNEAEWDLLSRMPRKEVDLISVIDHERVRQKGVGDLTQVQLDDLLMKVNAFAHDETSRSVVASSSRSQAFLKKGTQPGSATGIVMRSGTFLLHFLTEVVFSQLYRGAFQMQGPGRKAAYIGTYLTGMTLMGGVVTTIKELLAGRDIPSWETRKFWITSFAYGGGLSIYGDLIHWADRQGRPMDASQLAGPVLEPFFEIGEHGAKLMFGDNDFDKRMEDAATQMYRSGRRFAPGWNLWFLRPFVAAMDAALQDSLQGIIRPERITSGRLGNDPWMRPGKPPHRWPQISTNTITR